MEEEFVNFNTEIARYVVIVLAAPFWVPFVKKVWGEIENALKEEGGVFGRAPTPAELEEIREQKAREEDPLVNEPFVRGLAPSSQQNKRSTAPSGGGVGAPANSRPRGGFRS